MLRTEHWACAGSGGILRTQGSSVPRWGAQADVEEEDRLGQGFQQSLGYWRPFYLYGPLAAGHPHPLGHRSFLSLYLSFHSSWRAALLLSNLLLTQNA